MPATPAPVSLPPVSAPVPATPEPEPPRRMTASQEASLDAWMIKTYLACWKPAAQPADADPYVARVRLKFNPTDRPLKPPKLVNPPSDPAQKPQAKSVLQAVKACDPLPMPAEYRSFYEQWKTKTIHFDPQVAARDAGHEPRGGPDLNQCGRVGIDRDRAFCRSKTLSGRPDCANSGRCRLRGKRVKSTVRSALRFLPKRPRIPRKWALGKMVCVEFWLFRNIGKREAQR